MLIVENLLSADDFERVVALASPEAFVSGAATAGYRAIRVKNNLEMRRDEAASEIGLIVLNAVDGHPDVERDVIPAKAQAPLISRYTPGMAYGQHVDEPLSGTPRIRRDVSMTLFLADPDSYDGGELVIGGGPSAPRVKLAANSAVFYPSETLHHVEAVTRGERLAVVGWFQSHVRDTMERQLISDCLRVARRLHEIEPDGPVTDVAFQLWSNLLRRNAEN